MALYKLAKDSPGEHHAKHCHSLADLSMHFDHLEQLQLQGPPVTSEQASQQLQTVLIRQH